MEKITKYLDYTIWLSFLALSVITPLLFSTKNSELFEVPKMHFVYLVTIVILFATLIKFALQGKVQIPKSWPLLAFAVFIIIQILSTLFSIDKFTSVFGYPSRLNGGLLSQFTYLAIFYSALINLNLEKAKKLLLAIILTAFIVSLWGIPAHFGRDPSCLVMTGKLTSSCWQKDFDPNLRIFSTLGQPNWLASYLVLTIPFVITFALIIKRQKLKLAFIIISLIIFTALILTNSRAGFLGAGTALVIVFLFQGKKNFYGNLKFWLIFGTGIILITAIFGTTLFSRIGEIITKNQKINQTADQKLPTTNYQLPTTNTPTE